MELFLLGTENNTRRLVADLISPYTWAVTCLGYVWEMFGLCLGHVWDKFDTCLGIQYVWDMFGVCSGHVCDLGHAWDMFGKAEQYVLSSWDMP